MSLFGNIIQPYRLRFEPLAQEVLYKNSGKLDMFFLCIRGPIKNPYSKAEK